MTRPGLFGRAAPALSDGRRGKRDADLRSTAGPLGGFRLTNHDGLFFKSVYRKQFDNNKRGIGMYLFRGFVVAISLIVGSGPVLAEPENAMTGEQLQQLLAGGITLTLGGPGEGYLGTLELRKNGKGKGSAKTDAGGTIKLSGTWSIKGDQFCRKWADLSDGEEICESWVLTSDRSVEVYDGDRKIGVNSW